MSEDCKSDSSTSESEVSACSSSYNPLKALYSDKVKIPVESAPLYENIAQFEAAQSKANEVIPFGQAKLVQKREEEKEKKRIEEERLLEEKNKRRFAQYETGNILRLCFDNNYVNRVGFVILRKLLTT